MNLLVCTCWTILASGNESCLVNVYDPFIAAKLGWRFCWKILHLCLSGILVCSFVLLSVLTWLWCQGNASLVTTVWKCSLFFDTFWIFWGLVLIILQMFGKMYPWEDIWPWTLLFQEIFDHWFNTLLLTGLFRFSISS